MRWTITKARRAYKSVGLDFDVIATYPNRYPNAPNRNLLGENLGSELFYSFIWVATPEGHRFWADICDRLKNLKPEDFSTEESFEERILAKAGF